MADICVIVPTSSRRHWAPRAPLVLLLAFAGCGDGRVARYPVTGAVLVDGQPAPGAIVIFVPVAGSEALERERPFSRTDAEGKFKLRTFEPGDGAPAGDYQVIVRWPGAETAPPVERGQDARDAPAAVRDRLRGRYATPERTTLRATVAQGNNELPPFELSTR